MSSPLERSEALLRAVLLTLGDRTKAGGESLSHFRKEREEHGREEEGESARHSEGSPFERPVSLFQDGTRGSARPTPVW